MKILAWLLTATALTAVTPAFADDASLQTEVAALKAQLAAQKQLLAAQSERLDQLEAQVKAGRQPMAEQGAAGSVSATGAALAEADAAAPASAMGANAPAGPDTTIGGYGEISYNGYVHDASRNQADLKRFVLFVGHRFSDRLSFNSEVEVEHAVSSAADQGEVEIEQAYLNYAFRPALNVKAGLFLMPFGFLNRNHEPPVFFGVERNEVETRIIPSTWREGGVSIWGDTAIGLSYDAGVTTGFDVAKFDDAGSPLAAAHQELQLAKAASLSYYGALEYKGIPGLLLGGAIFHGGVLHSNADFRADSSLPDFAGIHSHVTLWDVHGRWQHKGLDIQALYARGTYSGAARIDSVLLAHEAESGEARPLVPSAFHGWLVQGAYSFPIRGDASIDPFVRYEFFDTQASMPLALTADPANHDRVLTSGFSFHPLHDVVVKLDYQHYFENSDNDRVNVGLGYMF